MMMATDRKRITGTRSLVFHGLKALPVVLTAALGVILAGCNFGSPMSPDRHADASTQMALPAEDDRGSVRSLGEVFTGAGDINAAIGAFRTALGTLNPNQPGSFGSGRREINWDAVPAQFTNTDDFPADFFNQPVPGRARGAVFSTPGAGLREHCA